MSNKSNEIKITDVVRSYNGKSGCMCGCLGTYKLPSIEDIEAENERVGYEHYDASNVSPRSISIAVKKINTALKEQPECVNFGKNNDFAWVDDGNRNTVVYFN